MASQDLFSWTSQDPRNSKLFNSWGVLYRFQTEVAPNGQTITTVYRTSRPGKEDRAARLEWAPNGGLGRAVIGKSQLPMADLVRPDNRIQGSRVFNGPDGLPYRWRPHGNEVVLQDPNGITIAVLRPTRPTRYQIGDVYNELQFLRNAGAGTVTHPPFMDYVTVTLTLYRFVAAFGL
ncbi:hypothetical protein JAAARDRAFT_52699 [Jaapia argillacea MUCL 33604]|uniref:DUF6593 domain-containing protein n=1 Tax=Jaapia argillacea MUCL 33604 TaxID=933084 RepID=A0A067QEZ9_9AGAM|nr:hypothetical protein JAAARDRAFT_52699 [Jaapia argillacea MUCL 33604]